MKRLHARYPFLEAAREAVEAAEVDLADLVRDGGPAVERAAERVETCLTAGTVGDPHGNPRTELLSYPVARVLVSLLDRPALVRRYADAEARTAHERFVDELPDPARRSSRRAGPGADRDGLTLRRLLAEFDLAGQVRVHEDADARRPDDADRFRVHVGAYLPLAADLSGEDWRLPTRALADGEVPVTREELLSLLREAVRERVAEGLPFEVPDPVASALTGEVQRLQDGIGDHQPPGRVDAVVPELFPPCVTALLERVEAGESLAPPSRFLLVSFLVSAGLDPEAVGSLFPDDEAAGAAAYQARRLGTDRGSAYAPPSCDTVQAYGDCVNPDARCETIADPLSYYADALDDAGEATDWRAEETPLAERL